MRRLNAVVLLLVFFLLAVGACREQVDGNSGEQCEDRTVSLAFANSVTQYVFVAEDFCSKFPFNLIFGCRCLN